MGKDNLTFATAAFSLIAVVFGYFAGLFAGQEQLSREFAMLKYQFGRMQIIAHDLARSELVADGQASVLANTTPEPPEGWDGRRDKWLLSAYTKSAELSAMRDAENNTAQLPPWLGPRNLIVAGTGFAGGLLCCVMYGMWHKRREAAPE